MSFPTLPSPVVGGLAAQTISRRSHTSPHLATIILQSKFTAQAIDADFPFAMSQETSHSQSATSLDFKAPVDQAKEVNDAAFAANALRIQTLDVALASTASDPMTDCDAVSAAESKRLRRKIDWNILTLLFYVYTGKFNTRLLHPRLRGLFF